MSARVVVAGSGAICAAGKSPEEIWEAVRTGRSAIRPIQQWDASRWPTSLAGEIPDLEPRALVEDRKVRKLLQRTHLLGLYAAGRAIDNAGLVAYRGTLAPEDAAAFNDRTGVYVGAGGDGYQNEYEFFPLFTAANGDLGTFGRELAATVDHLMSSISSHAGTTGATRVAVLSCLHLADRLRVLERDLASLKQRVDQKTEQFALMLDQVIEDEA